MRFRVILSVFTVHKKKINIYSTNFYLNENQYFNTFKREVLCQIE